MVLQNENGCPLETGGLQAEQLEQYSDKEVGWSYNTPENINEDVALLVIDGIGGILFTGSQNRSQSP